MTDPTLTNLIAHYSSENLIKFFQNQNRTRDFSRSVFAYPSFDDDLFSKVTRLGQITFPESDLLSIWSIQVSSDLSQRSGKLAQYKKATKILSDFLELNGIFVFHDSSGNFRFSLIYKDPEGTKGIGSNYKRFTYFVSPELTNKTFCQRFDGVHLDSLETVKNTFSVEPVTTQFFNEFRRIFDKTKREFTEANKNTVLKRLESKYQKEDLDEQVNKFTFTFLGRIIFLYFLLRKGWIEGRSDYVRCFVEDKTNHNLYQTLLEPLFFEVFAKEESRRSPDIIEMFKDTPYLNGGLFEHSELELEMKKEGILILFRDLFIRDIINNFFEAYNFTVDENSPDDQEVSIDPEMLGKVFENTLAEEERNRMGTFYTPREIVHFMVRQSIERYLLNETSVDSGKIHELIYSSNSDFPDISIREAETLDEKLEAVKVLDPSVGSGAFPVEFMNTLIELRKKLNVRVGKRINEVVLKKSIIKNNLYGVDIDPSAVEIAKLRLWLSLIVDYDRSLVEPLPSLDFQFRVGNSLQETIDGIDVFQTASTETQMGWIEEDEAVRSRSAQMIQLKDEFYATTNEEIRHSLKKQFDTLEQELIQSRLNDLRNLYLQQSIQRTQRDQENAQKTLKRIEALEQKIEDGTYKLFKPDFHFSEVYERTDEQGRAISGFDIVIGNPPYGVSVDNEIRDRHGLGSRDSYGVFISTSLKRFLKPGGVLEFITSDTWLTIKTHKQLRSQVLNKTLHRVIRLHQDCFNATVNVNILSLSNSPASEENYLIAADLTNHSTREEVDELQAILQTLPDQIGRSTEKYAVFSYPQQLVRINSNTPIFVGSPKIFLLTQDVDCQTVSKSINGKQVPVRQIEFNDKTIEIVRFGDIAEVKQGLATGDNWTYLYQNPEARGSYHDINQYRQFLVTEDELKKIGSDDKLRMKIVEKGFHKTKDEKNFDPDRWFEGRYIVPYDKGGESDTGSGWLPNYYVPTNYFIDWSSWALNRMRTLTIGKRDGTSRTQIAGVFRNVVYYFTEGLTLSYTGVYAPNLRLNSIGVFDVGGSSIFTEFDFSHLLGLYAGKMIKFIGKNYIDHTVNFQVDENKELAIPIKTSDEIEDYVSSIVEKQKNNPRYPYHLYEQKEIDRIVYELYGLNEEDIREIETWYARRYPKLVNNLLAE